ncbi:MAG: hypothetical protein HY735_13015 [Verrucomicrobia bacterium]|nr:hypothetical protein [Verrucomicrobiota bacterium]
MDQQAIFNFVRLPARLDTRQAAQVLGFNEHDIPILIRAKLLKCLGQAAPNAPKYFASCEVQELAADPDWLHKATKAISSHWREKNERRLLAKT